MTDDLSDYGKLSALYSQLRKARAASTDDAEQNRLTHIIENLERLMGKDRGNPELLKQLKENIADMARYREGK